MNTYGPLGFLLHPIAYKDNFEVAVYFRLVVLVLSFLLIYSIDKIRRSSIVPMVLFAVVLFITFDYTYVFGVASKNWERIIYNNNITLFIILVTYATLISRQHFQNICFLILAFSSAILSIAKFQYGLISVACLVYALVVSAILDRGQFVRNALCMLLGLALAIPIYKFFFLDASNVLLFLRGSLEITSGYSETVALQGPFHQVAAAILLILMFAATIITNTKNTVYISVYLIGLFFCFIFFKHAFTRHDSHSASFYLCFAVLSSTTVLVSMSRPSRVLLSVASVLSLLILLTQNKSLSAKYTGHGSLSGDMVMSKLEFEYTKGIFDIGRLKKSISSKCCSYSVLCPEMLSLIDQKKTSLWTLNLLHINSGNIDFRPFYVYQEYNNYTHYLDSMTASKLSGKESSPQCVIFHFDGIDGRNPFMDSPVSMRMLLEKYSGKELCGMHLLSRKSIENNATELKTLESEIVSPNVEVSVPNVTEDVFMSVSLEYTAFGKLCTMLKSLPPVYIVMTDENNVEYEIRISPKPIASPFLINRVPRTKDHFSKYLKNEEYPRILRLRLTGPGLKYFKASIPISFYKNT